jgi:hypothetical protein
MWCAPALAIAAGLALFLSNSTAWVATMPFFVSLGFGAGGRVVD